MEPFRSYAELREAEEQERLEREIRLRQAREARLRVPEPETIAARRTVPPPIWMITLADLIALVLTFFVLMFAMSTTNPQTWQAIRESLSQSLRQSNPLANPGVQARPVEMPYVTIPLGTDLTYLGAVMEAKAPSTPLLQEASISREHDRLVVALPTELLFAPASAELRAEALPALATMAGILNTVRNEVAVEGHAGAVGGGAGEFEANWELSLARAVAVATALQKSGYTGEILPIGRGIGDGVALPEEAAAGTEEAEDLARRVDIVIRSARAGTLPGGSLRPQNAAAPAAGSLQ